MLCGLTLDTMFVNDKTKRSNYNSRNFRNRGFYSVMIEHQLIPVLLGKPYMKTEKTKHNEYTRWVAPIGMAYEVKTEDSIEWFFPIFKSVSDFKKSKLGKSLLTANKWWKPEAWEKTFEESDCAYFTPIVPIGVKGPDGDYLNQPYSNQSGYKADNEGNAYPNAKNEMGKLYDAPCPTFIVPTPITTGVNPMTGRGGGRYHNILPINELWLKAYSELKIGRKIHKPHKTKKSTGFKALSKKEIPLLPKQLFMEQYAKNGDNIIEVQKELFWLSEPNNLWQSVMANPAAHQQNTSAIEPLVVLKEDEVIGSLMRGYLGNKYNDFYNKSVPKEKYLLNYHDGKEERFLSIDWPLDKSMVFEGWLAGNEDVVKNTQLSISLPRVFTYYTFDGGQINGTPNNVEYWPKSPEGYVNYSYLDFLTPSIWDLESV